MVDDNLTAQQLVQKLVGQGLSVSNVTVNCPADSAYGWFEGISTIGIDSGLLMTTGSIHAVPGPASDFASTAYGGPGDADLDNIVAPFTTNDACVIAFDLVPKGDTIKFNYVFGSEEYHEFVCSNFNDVFAFFISGPGISGLQNLALIPGTTTPVAINSVNNGSNDINGCSGVACDACPCNNTFFIDNFCPTGNTIAYDGLTITLTALAAVIPCETYTLKLAIADAGDDVLDSGVFIEEGSLESNLPTLEVNTTVGADYPFATAGCIDGYFNFLLPQAVSETTVIHFGVGGSAVNGVHYEPIADSIIYFPGQDSTAIKISPIAGSMTNPPDTVTLYLYSACDNTPYDSASLIITEMFEPVIASDTSICRGDTAQLFAAGGLTFSWTPSASLSNPNVPDPEAFPLTTTTYTVTMSVDTCSAEGAVTVYIMDSTEIDRPSPFCLDDNPADLSATPPGGTWWGPGIVDSDNGTFDPSVADTGMHEVMYGVAGECGDTTSVFVEVGEFVGVDLDAAGPYCAYDSVFTMRASVTGGIWSGTGITDPDAGSFNPAVAGAGSHTVIYDPPGVCMEKGSLTIEVFEVPNAYFEPVPSVTSLTAPLISFENLSSHAVSWHWDFGIGATSIEQHPSFAYPDTGVYEVVLTAENEIGCEDFYITEVIIGGDVYMPNAFTPDGDGVNDIFQPVGLLGDGVENYHMQVWNRWGELIFSTNDNKEGWNGHRHNTSNQVQHGIYTYYVTYMDLEDVQQELKGYVVLVR